MDPARAEVPPPRDQAAPPRVLVAELRELVGDAECSSVCAALLSGAEPALYAGELGYLGGRPGPHVLDGTWAGYWARVWGARGLLYVWDPTAAAAVVAGVSDPHWRVAEMCLKVSALRELAEAGDPAMRLADHELPRVRASAVRALGILGDTEHLETVVQAREDPEPSVRRAAELALIRLAGRLDIDLSADVETRED